MTTHYNDIKNVSSILSEFGEQLSPEQMGTLIGVMQKKLEEVNPLENLQKKKYYTPTIMEKLYGIPKKVVGKIANNYGLKTSEFGVACECTDSSGNVWPGFKYNEQGRDKILNYYEQDYAN